MIINKDKAYLNIFFALFWIRALVGFIVDEAGASGLGPIVFLVYDAGIVSLGIVSLKHNIDKIYLLSFFVIGYWITCMHNGYSTVFYLNGLRDFISLLFLLPIFRHIYASPYRKEEFIRRFDKTLYIFLYVQAFCLVWQFLKYGANDHGGGSLGNRYSGVISTLIYFTSFYLMKRRLGGNSEDIFQRILRNKDLIFLLLPTFLNETKISFIFLICYFLLIMPVDKKFIMRIVYMSPILLVLVMGVFWVYLNATGNESDITSLEYYTEEYLYADEESDVMRYAEALNDAGDEDFEDIPRMVKLVLLPELNDENPGHEITGYGVGQFKGGTLVDSSRFYKENEWMLTGSIPYSFHMYIQMGFIGFVLLIWLIVNLIMFKAKGVKSEKGIFIFGLVILLLVMFYNDSLRLPFFVSIIMYGLVQSLHGELTHQENI